MKQQSGLKRSLLYLSRTYQIYLMILPALVMVIVFCYIPMYGIQIAFKDFNLARGIGGSAWIGLEHFIRFFRTPVCWRVIRTTLVISIYSLVVGFPIPILLAFMINEVRSTVFKKTVQMVSYAPYFISTVALCGMLLLFLKKDTGFINALIALFGGERADLISNPSAFSSIYVWSGIWQTMGWSSIIYIAALSAVNPEIVEAAVIDGVTRFQKIIHVDLPTILPTVVILLILSAGSILGVGSEKVLLLQNSLNMEASDVISTYTYRLGILERQYGYTTAIGLLNSVINALVLVLVNTMARRLGETSLW